MKDKDFLFWIHQRLLIVHHENPSMDYMHKLRAIIEITPDTQETPNTICTMQFHVKDNITFSKCSICGEPQFHTPSGVTCLNGHGGANAA